MIAGIKFRQTGAKSRVLVAMTCFRLVRRRSGRALVRANPADPQRRRVSAAPRRNAIAKLVSGAWRVTVRSLAKGCPGRWAASIADRSRSTAIRKPSVTSSIVRETSVAASMARSAMLGEGMVCGVSLSKARTPIESAEAATFGYPRVRVFEQRARRPLAIRDRRRCERRVAASSGKCGTVNFVPSIDPSIDMSLHAAAAKRTCQVLRRHHD
jgi:hypothetical protein